ncbi:hypothetical protein [Streptosporangium subroseum]|uniref:hypothetical protein n=1 Tax=Streptosporangium subroseum TaxID=106412 RepID=UPI00308802CB|nr:hypothetical protein OHB15_21025 [Streptosporangium subroseum]
MVRAAGMTIPAVSHSTCQKANPFEVFERVALVRAAQITGAEIQGVISTTPDTAVTPAIVVIVVYLVGGGMPASRMLPRT